MNRSSYISGNDASKKKYLKKKAVEYALMQKYIYSIHPDAQHEIGWPAVRQKAIDMFDEYTDKYPETLPTDKRQTMETIKRMMDEDYSRRQLARVMLQQIDKFNEQI